MIELDPIDRQILMILQRGIAIAPRPYLAMAEEIGAGLSEEEVIRRIARMKEEHIIRRMSGFFDSRRLGYQSVLVAVQPEPGSFDDAVCAINRYPRRHAQLRARPRVQHLVHAHCHQPANAGAHPR